MFTKKKFHHAIRFIDAPEGQPDAGAPAVEVKVEQQGGQQQDGQQEQAESGGDGEEDISSLPEWAQQYIGGLRSENAKTRTNAKKEATDKAKQDVAHQIGVALGIIKEDEKVSVDDLQATINRQNAERDADRREMYVLRHAASKNLDALALTDSRQFMDGLAKISPDDEAALAAALDGAKKDGRFALNPRAGSAGAERGTGGTGQRRDPKQHIDLYQAAAEHYGTGQ